MNLEMKDNKVFLILLLIIFIITEFIDLYLDKLLGVSFVHTIIQIILYLFLFLFTYILFKKYYNNKINILLSEDLINILKMIKEAEDNKIILNQKKIMSILKITKPTMKKKIETLVKLGYVNLEQKGNYKYLLLTSYGKSLLK